jgi:CAAX protease family protein
VNQDYLRTCLERSSSRIQPHPQTHPFEEKTVYPLVNDFRCKSEKRLAMIDAIVSTILQVVVFTLIPFFVYVVTHRRVGGFFAYLGLRRPERRTLIWATLLSTLFIWLTVGLFLLLGLRETLIAPNTVAGKLRAQGLSAETLSVLLLTAFGTTALAEEILFRGFLAKRLISWLGFGWGNLLQALLFGLLHLSIYAFPGAPAFSLFHGVGIVLATGLGGWMFGALNERLGNGSIVPSWWAHGLGNLLGYIYQVVFL